MTAEWGNVIAALALAVAVYGGIRAELSAMHRRITRLEIMAYSKRKGEPTLSDTLG